MTSDFNANEEKVEAKPEGSVQSDVDMKKIQTGMQEEPDVLDKEMEELLAGVQQDRDELDREMKEDLAKFEARPKPAHWQEKPAAGDAATGEHRDHWEDKGIIDVPVADLPDPDGVSGPEDFDHHITYDDAMQATERLQEMKPQIDQGYTVDDFAALDKQNGLEYADGQQRVYELFYGQDAIKVDKDGDTYDIVNGRHRIYAAKEGGYEFIPARVSEKVSS